MPTKINSNDQITNTQNEFRFEGELTVEGQLHENLKNDFSHQILQEKSTTLGRGFISETNERRIDTENHFGTTGKTTITVGAGEQLVTAFSLNFNDNVRNEVVHTKADGSNEVVHTNVRVSDFDL
jgi:hypothetical protein